MYYKLRWNSTQFVMYYKLRNYYKLQRNTGAQQEDWNPTETRHKWTYCTELVTGLNIDCMAWRLTANWMEETSQQKKKMYVLPFQTSLYM